jgi:serine protease Do
MISKLLRAPLLLVLIVFSFCVFATLSPNPTIAPMLKKVMPAVVNIKITGEIVIPDELFNQQGPGTGRNNPQTQSIPRTAPFEKLGSGVIVEAKHGYIITNAHVLKNAKVITVTLSDNRHFPAKLIGSDASSDVAVLQIDASDLHSIPLGNSDDLQVGDFVAAIGNPFGLSQTVTTGIVSALQRNDLSIEGLENFIQTDAAINPGNSGGALINFEGQLIGINTAIIAPAGGNVGIGFAIPINMARSIMDQLIKFGEVRRGLLGIFAQPLTPELAEAFKVPAEMTGTVITAIAPDSPAARSKLHVGDIIISINGKAVNTPFEVRNIIGLLRVGSQVKLKLFRDGKEITREAIITGQDTQMKEMREQQPFLNGLSLADVNQIFSSSQGMIQGVQVLNAPADSTAGEAGLMAGDIIVSANGQTVKNLEELYKAVSLNKKLLLLNVIRGPGAMFIVIK